MADPIMVRRVNAAQRTLDTFRGKPFQLGKRDCVRLTAAHLRLLGYRVKLPPAGSYRTANGALRKLHERGHATLADAMDALLPRIPPAGVLAGDVVQLEAEHPLGALAVVLGNGRVVGYHQDAKGAEVLQPNAIEAAWRAAPVGPA